MGCFMNFFIIKIINKVDILRDASCSHACYV